LLDGEHPGAGAVDFIAEPEAEVERDLFVAAAAGVDFIGYGSG